MQGSLHAAAMRSGVPAASTPDRCATSRTGSAATNSIGSRASTGSIRTCASCRKNRRRQHMPAKTERNSVVDNEARSIITSRVFDAPRQLVWKAWTSDAHLGHWWGPDGFTITTSRFEFRPGGEWVFVMHGPDGTDYKNHLIYREIVEPERIVYAHVTGPVFDATVTFSAEGSK